VTTGCVAGVVWALCAASTACGVELALDSDESPCPQAVTERPATTERAAPKARLALRCMMYLVL